MKEKYHLSIENRKTKVLGFGNAQENLILGTTQSVITKMYPNMVHTTSRTI